MREARSLRSRVEEGRVGMVVRLVAVAWLAGAGAAQSTAGTQLWPINPTLGAYTPANRCVSLCPGSHGAVRLIQRLVGGPDIDFPCSEDPSVAAKFSASQCPVDCSNSGSFTCADGTTTIPYWRQCDGVNDCPTDRDGNAVTVGTSCQHVAGEQSACATDEVGSGCSGMIDTMIGGGVTGLRNDGAPEMLTFDAPVNSKVTMRILDTLESSFLWDYHRAVIEGTTNSECELYEQKEVVSEDLYVVELSNVIEYLPEDLGSPTTYRQYFGQPPPSIVDGIGSSRVQIEADKQVYIELKPTVGFVGRVTFNYTIKSCDAARTYLHTPCALQKFDSGPIPVTVTFLPHECSLCTTEECNAKLNAGTYGPEDWAAYCEHGTCHPVGGHSGEARRTGCECERGWRGRRCDIQVESERPDESGSIWTLVFGLLIIALVAIFVNRFIVLGEPLPLFARPLDWPCLIEVCPCFEAFIPTPKGVEVVRPVETEPFNEDYAEPPVADVPGGDEDKTEAPANNVTIEKDPESPAPTPAEQPPEQDPPSDRSGVPQSGSTTDHDGLNHARDLEEA